MFAGDQVRRLITEHPDYFPLFTRQGKWKHESEAWTNWCEGFLGGMLWILARHTGDPWWRERAEHYALLIEHRKTDRDVHDLGFLFLPTWKEWYDCDRRSGQKPGTDRGGPDPGVTLSTGRQISALFCGAGEPFHRHHDERRNHFLRCRANQG